MQNAAASGPLNTSTDGLRMSTRYGVHANRNGVLMYALGAFLFSVGGIVSKTIMESGLDALQWAPIRALVSSVILIFFIGATNRSAFRLQRAELPLLPLYGLIFLATQFLYITSIQHLPVAIGTILVFLAVANVAIWNWFRHAQRPGSGGLSSISLALLGAVFITGILSGQISGNLDAIGLAAGFGNSVLFAAYLLVGARLQRHRDAPSLLMWATIGMTLGWSIIKPWWNYPWHKLTGSSMVFYDHGPVLPLWSMILFVAVVGTVLPFGLVLGSVARIGAQRGSIIGASEPIWAALIAFLALNELLGPMQLVGGALIVAAIVVGETWAMRANRHDEVDRI